MKTKYMIAGPFMIERAGLFTQIVYNVAPRRVLLTMDRVQGTTDTLAQKWSRLFSYKNYTFRIRICKWIMPFKPRTK